MLIAHEQRNKLCDVIWLIFVKAIRLMTLLERNMKDLTTVRRWDIEKMQIICHEILNLVIIF